MEDSEGGSNEKGCVLRLIKFSVLISVYKNEKPEYLKIALDSMKNQTLQPNEYVIVKDGFLTEALDACIDTFVEQITVPVKVLAFKQNRGLGLALHDGVLACSNEYIARMDTDDIAKPERFAKQIIYLEKHPEIALLGSRITEFSTDAEHPDTITQLPLSDKDIRQYAKSRNPFRHMTLIYKKSAVLDAGNYRDFLWFEDYDLWVRIMQKGYKVENLPECLVNVRADDAMFARRGGWKYLKQDIKFQKWLLNMDFINAFEYYKNLGIRILARCLPNQVRVFLYKNLLRK